MDMTVREALHRFMDMNFWFLLALWIVPMLIHAYIETGKSKPEQKDEYHG